MIQITLLSLLDYAKVKTLHFNDKYLFVEMSSVDQGSNGKNGIFLLFCTKNQTDS